VSLDLVVRLESWIRDPDRLVVVAERDGRVVGWAMLAHRIGYVDAPDGWYVSALTVHPDWRRRRIGDRLLSELLAWPRASGSVVRSVVNAVNLPSLDLHRRHGFGEVGRAATFAGITFVGGVGVLLAAERGPRDLS
jgi:phosphinothricin acetyltransferase